MLKLTYSKTYILVLLGLSCSGLVAAQEVTVRGINSPACQADQRYDDLQTKATNLFSSYQTKLDAVLNCQAQKKFWDGATCQGVTVTSPTVVNRSVNVVNKNGVQISSMWNRYCDLSCAGPVIGNSYSIEDSQVVITEQRCVSGGTVLLHPDPCVGKPSFCYAYFMSITAQRLPCSVP
jgi:hypothetical protein